MVSGSTAGSAAGSGALAFGVAARGATIAPRTGRRGYRGRRRGIRGLCNRRGAAGLERAFQALDAFEQRLDARPRFSARDTDDRDFEHEARIGDGLLAQVDDRLAEDLDRAHDGDVAHRLRERGELRGLFGAGRRTAPGRPRWRP